MSPVTPDWYPDPYGRHESRYWDGMRWTVEVSDQGVEQTETPVGLVTLESMASRNARTGVLVGHRQTIASLFVRAVNALGLYFFFIASGLLMAANSGTRPPSEGYLRWIAWVFDYTSGTFVTSVRVSYPPIIVFIALIVGTLAVSRIEVHPKQRVGLQFGKAGRANRAAYRTFKEQCHQLNFAGVQNPKLIQAKSWIGFVAMTALAATGLGHLLTTDSDIGVGVYLAVVLGVVGAISFLLIRPPRHPRNVVVSNTGVLLVEVDGQLRPAVLDTLTDRGTLKTASR